MQQLGRKMDLPIGSLGWQLHLKQLTAGRLLKQRWLNIRGKLGDVSTGKTESRAPPSGYMTGFIHVGHNITIRWRPSGLSLYRLHTSWGKPHLCWVMDPTGMPADCGGCLLSLSQPYPGNYQQVVRQRWIGPS